MATVPVHQPFEAILDHVAEAVTVQGPGGEIVHANLAALDLLGFETLDALLEAPRDALLRRFRIWGEDGAELPPERLPGRRALLGEEPEPIVVRWRPAGERTPERWSRIRSRPFRDESGEVQLAVNLIEDITELKIAERRHRFLAEAGRVLASSLHYEDTLRRVAELAVPEIADWCVVDLVTRDGFDRVAVAHVDPAKLEFAHELMRRYPPDPRAEQGVPRVLRSGVAELYPVIPQELLEAVAQDAQHLELLRSVGMVSAMIVPLRGHDAVLGAVTMVSAEAARSFGEADLELAEELGRRAGIAVENARLHHRRSEIARVLQRSLLPPVLPEIDGVELAAAFRAAGDGAEVGGDFYDVFPTADHWFVVIGDVCGKGSPAAAATALARYTIRSAAVRRRSPAAIARRLNETMLRQRDPGQPFCTLAIVRLEREPAGVRVTVASAGHPLPRIVRANGAVQPLGRPGTLLGVTPDVVIEDRTAALSPGDTLVLYTDGLTEARAPGLVWDDGALDAALGETPRDGGPQALVDALSAAALGAGEPPPRDDLAILALRAATG